MMATRTRLRLRAALLTASGIIHDLGTGLSFHDRESGRDDEGGKVTLVQVGTIELPIRLDDARGIVDRGVLRSGEHELYLGQDAERLVNEAKSARQAAARRFSGPEASRANTLPLYADPKRYEHEGLL